VASVLAVSWDGGRSGEYSEIEIRLDWGVVADLRKGELKWALIIVTATQGQSPIDLTCTTQPDKIGMAFLVNLLSASSRQHHLLGFVLTEDDVSLPWLSKRGVS
jgi:hypothetical protein